MTVDERLEKLVERHEALAQTVQLVAGMQPETERRFAANGIGPAQLMDTMKRLGRIASP